jgi:hypothetical protein
MSIKVYNGSNMNDEIIKVDVRNSKGMDWQEQWAKKKLAYFILMADLIPPKFDRSLQTEWVPFQMNKYRWDKGSLSLEEFEQLASRWPGRKLVPFDSRTCVRVQIAYKKSPSEGLGFGFDPPREPLLFDRLVAIASGKIRYETFDYADARHIFLLELDADGRTAVQSQAPVLEAMQRVNPEFVQIVKGGAGRLEVRFQCPDGLFKPPFQLWFEL